MIVDSTTTIIVSFTGQHTFVSDLGFYLLAPGYGPGQLNASIPGNYGVVELLPCISNWNSITSLPTTVLGCDSFYQGNCNSGNDFSNFDFSSTLPASNPNYTACICNLTTPLTGIYASAGPWSTIYGFDAYTQGWGLQIYDMEPIDIGYLTSATVYFIKGTDTVKYVIPNGSYPINDGISDYNSASYFQLSQNSTLCNLGIANSNITNCSSSNSSDGAIDISVFGGAQPYSYLWNNGAATEDLVNIPIGYYTVQVTDSTGACSVSGTFMVNGAIDSCNLSITNTYILPSSSNSSDGSIDITVSGGTPPYYYSWNNGASTEDLNQISNGTYEVYIYDNNQCSGYAYINLNDSSTSVFYAYVDVYNETSFGACDGMVAVYPSGGTSPYQYLWSNGSTTQYIQGLCEGYYDVTVYDATQNSYITGGYVYYDSINTGCSAYFYAYLNDTTQNPLTTYNFYDYSSSNTIEWSWEFGDGSNSVEQNPMHAFPAIGTYTVCLTIVTSDSCVNTYCESLFIGNDTTVVDTCNIYVDGFVSNCTSANVADGAIDLTVYGGTAPFTYYWSGGNGQTYNTMDLINISFGNYYVSVIDANGCVGSQQFNVSYGIDSTYCDLYAYYDYTPISYIGASDGSIDVTVVGGTAPYTYLWNNGVTTQDLYNVSSGNYSLTITDNSSNCPDYVLDVYLYEPYDSNGGQVIDSLYTDNVDTCFVSTVDSFYVSGVNINSNSTITVIWEFVAGGVTYVIEATYTCTLNGNYVIYLTINCGSAKGLTTYMTYIHADGLTSSPILSSETNIGIYPNPVKDKLNISLNNIELSDAILNIYNVSGQIVYSSKVTTGDVLEINTTNLSGGVYIIKMINDKNQYISKFIK
ncbi:MAG: hypothetical protein A2046_09765 [Bacteroidetes bacterium GWA2_30_7]|nr:MAG: hypothetical protein A2046_09765 [Bacteroidetes bacterium GWA2_30_7]